MFTKGAPKPAGSGRKRGVPNKTTGLLKDRIAATGCDPFMILAKIADNVLECSVCDGTGKTQYQALNGEKPGVRICQSCWGKKKERIEPKVRGWAAGELAQYLEPKRKAIEVSGDDTKPPVRLSVEFVKANG